MRIEPKVKWVSTIKILLWDLETSPHLANVWSLWDQNVPLVRLRETGEVICFASQWLDSKKVEFYSTHHHGKEAMLQAAWDLMNEADALVSWNGKSFDTKTMHKEFLLAGMSPPSPSKEIDLMLVAKKQFRLVSNKLEYVSKALGLEGKAQHEGFELWLSCMAGDDRAWGRMKRYNIQDVRLLKDIYYKLQPWIVNHPSVALYDDHEGCPSCGSENLRKEGFAYTSLGKFQRYVCIDCGRWSKSGKRIAGVELRSA